MVMTPRGGVPRLRPDLGLASARSRSARRRTAPSSPAQGTFYLQAGAFPGSPIRGAAGCAFAPYDIPNVHSLGFDVVSNRSKVAAYRAPGAPIGAYAVECVLDELAETAEDGPAGSCA